MLREKLFGLAAVSALAGAITTVASAGCDSDYGETSTSSSSSGDNAVDAAGSDAGAIVPSCPPGCLPPPAAGWAGPVAVYDGPPEAKPADCPALYSEKKLEAHRGTQAGAPTCNCGSGTPAKDARCIVSIESHALSDCKGKFAIFDASVPDATCFSSGVPAYVVRPPTVDRGTCTYPEAGVTGPAPTYEKVEIACALPQEVACAERAGCLATPSPAAPFDRLCIHTRGDQACPLSAYSVRFVAHEKTIDERSCACGGKGESGSCGPFFATGTATCPSKSGLPGSFNACTAAPSVVISGLAPDIVKCETGAMTGWDGGVKDLDPVTFCCNR